MVEPRKYHSTLCAKGKAWRSEKKSVDNEEGKEEPWKRGKKEMNNKEGKEGSWKRGRKGMNDKEGKEEQWKREKVRPEKREGEMTNKVEKEKHSTTYQKRAKRSFDMFHDYFFSTLLATPSSFFQIRSSLSSLVLPFPLYFSPLSCIIFSPCRPGPVPGT